MAGKVCDCLKIKNSADALKGIKERHLRFGDKIDGVGISYIVIIDTLGRKNRASVISEKVLYELIFRSNTKKAFDFQQWVFAEVLPSLRKRGEYRMQGKLIRRSMTDTIKETGEAERMSEKGTNAYSQYSVMVNRSLGLPFKVDRDKLSEEMLEKIATRENLVAVLLKEGKSKNQIEEIFSTLKTA